MPPRANPQTLVLRVKSHKTTVFVTIPSSATIEILKKHVQGALNAHAEAEAERGLPLPIESPDDFLLTLRRPNAANKPSFMDIPEDNASKSLLQLNVKNWDAVYLRWRVDGVYEPVQVTLPRLDAPSDEDEPQGSGDDDEEMEAPAPPKNKGKGRA